MCAGCMGTADFLLTGGMLGAASLKVAGRRLVPGWRGRGKVTDAEAEAFVARVSTPPSPAARPVDDATPLDDGLIDPQPSGEGAVEPPTVDEPVPV